MDDYLQLLGTCVEMVYVLPLYSQPLPYKRYRKLDDFSSIVDKNCSAIPLISYGFHLTAFFSRFDSKKRKYSKTIFYFFGLTTHFWTYSVEKQSFIFKITTQKLHKNYIDTTQKLHRNYTVYSVFSDRLFLFLCFPCLFIRLSALSA